MAEDHFMMEMCGNKAAWQIVPEGIEKIDLEQVGTRIVSSGYEIGIITRLCWTFTGVADLTLYPSGKLLVKTQDQNVAKKIAKQHLSEWIG